MGLRARDRDAFCQGLSRINQSGVSIYVDDILSDEHIWPLIICDSSDSSFYMGDFILDDADGTLKEIRFNKLSINKEGGICRAAES